MSFSKILSKITILKARILAIKDFNQQVLVEFGIFFIIRISNLKE